MFTDFIALMLVNLAAGLALLAHYLYKMAGSGHRPQLGSWILCGRLGRVCPGVRHGYPRATAGWGGLLALPALEWRDRRWIALAGAVILGLPAGICAGYEALWSHILDFSKWLPPTADSGARRKAGALSGRESARCRKARDGNGHVTEAHPTVRTRAAEIYPKRIQLFTTWESDLGADRSQIAALAQALSAELSHPPIPTAAIEAVDTIGDLVSILSSPPQSVP